MDMESFPLYCVHDARVDDLACEVYLRAADGICLRKPGIITLDERFIVDFPRIIQVSPTMSLGAGELSGTVSTFLVRHAYDSVVIPTGTRVAFYHVI